jgi:hypothetical protein
LIDDWIEGFVDVEREKRCGHWVVGEEKLRYNKTHKHQT